MRLGMVGLGRMGANMTLRLLERHHEVVAWDRNEEAVKGVASEGAEGASSLSEVVHALAPPRVVWLMLPSGRPTEETILALEDLLDDGDVVVDGGNSNYRLAVADAARLAEKGVAFVDAGVSGGVWGLKEGYCLMIGGEADAVEYLEPV